VLLDTEPEKEPIGPATPLMLALLEPTLSVDEQVSLSRMGSLAGQDAAAQNRKSGFGAELLCLAR
jgi:hypothetical protein